MTQPTLELRLAAEDLPQLLREPAFRAAARRKPSRLTLIWHDTPAGTLAAEARCLVQHQTDTPAWHHMALVPRPGEIWPPGAPAPILAAAASSTELPGLPAGLLPVAAFEGEVRRLSQPEDATTITLLHGQLRAVTATATACRLTLSGPEAIPLATALSASLRLEAALPSLAEEALTLAGRRIPQRPLGAPGLDTSQDVNSGFALVLAHLSCVILHHARLAANTAAEFGPEPVHQMRVALRRLRSAIGLFRRAVACPELDAVAASLKTLGRHLGPPRDWDVFTANTGRKVGLAFPDDPGITRLLSAAERRRRAAYTGLRAHLASPEFRATGIALAGLALTRPWQIITTEDPEEGLRLAELQRSNLRDYAGRALNRRLARVTAPGPDLSGLALPALHDIRLHAKRLRYACEFFSPLFPGRETRRFLRRMSTLQERLGLINDGVVAQALMQELPGAGRTHAAGVVRGFVAGQSSAGLRKLERSWQRFLRLEPFWD